MDPTALAEHQRFLAAARSRLFVHALWLRVATLAGVSSWVLVHGQGAEPRYLFVAPLVALVGGVLDVGVVRREMLFGALAKLPVPVMATEAVEGQVPWRRAVYRSAVPWLHLPVMAVAAGITIDAQAARPGWSAEGLWVAALVFALLGIYAVLLGAWWSDRAAAAQASAAPPVPLFAAAMRPSMPAPAPFVAPVAAPVPMPAVIAAAPEPEVQRTPSLVPDASPGPFPVKRVDTKPASFGSPVGG